MSLPANHADASTHNDLFLNLALRALGANPVVSSGSRDTLEQARASSDVTDCSARSTENVGLNPHRAAPSQPSSSFQNQQMQQQQQQMQQQQQQLQLLLQRLQQQAEPAVAAVAERLQPQPPAPQQQQQQFGSPAPNAALVSSLLQQLASTYAASPAATAAGNVDFRSTRQSALPAGFVAPTLPSQATTGATRGATSADVADAAINSKNAALSDSNQAAALLQIARIVAASPGSRGPLGQLLNAAEGGASLFPSSSVRPTFASDAPPFAAHDAPPYTSIYPTLAVGAPQTTSAAAWLNPRNSPSPEGPRASLRDLNIAAAAPGSPQGRGVGGIGAYGEEASSERASLKRKSWDTVDSKERRAPNSTFPTSRAAGKSFGALFSPPAGFNPGVFSSEGAGEFRLSESSEEEGEGKESGRAFTEGQGEWENGEAEGEGEGGEVNGNKKKMRLTREQLSMLEDFFKKHPHLTPRQKAGLAKSLGVRVRQVEVWFQNRRARTKVKQTEAELEGLRRRCQQLAEENKRLKLQLATRERNEEEVQRKEMVGTSRIMTGKASENSMKAFETRGAKCSFCHAAKGLEVEDTPVEEGETPFITFL